jgi:hypothetical protein
LVFAGLGRALPAISVLPPEVYKGADAGTSPRVTASMMKLGFAKRKIENAAALDHVREWTRGRFALLRDETVMVSEVSCSVPGCPPIETHIVFWTARGRHHYRIFKPLAEVTADDLPPAFMKNALIASDGADCDCC